MSIIDNIIETMEYVEFREIIGGNRKKEIAMALLEKAVIDKWNIDFWNKHKDIIPVLIDFICALTKNELVLNINQRIPDSL